jgi:hypothetical protein
MKQAVQSLSLSPRTSTVREMSIEK